MLGAIFVQYILHVAFGKVFKVRAEWWRIMDVNWGQEIRFMLYQVKYEIEKFFKDTTALLGRIL